MGLEYRDLDEATRRFMIDEIEIDRAGDRIYLSPWLTEAGVEAWPDLLLNAARLGSDDSLADELRTKRLLRQSAQRRNPKGGYTTYTVPTTAPATMAEGEFNRFYVRGVCRRAIEDGIELVMVYRAKAVEKPRPESEAKIGTTHQASAILEDLRKTPGLEPALGLPPGPNSGLTVHLVR